MKIKERKQLVVLVTLCLVALLGYFLAIKYMEKLEFYDEMIDSRERKILSLQQQIVNKPALNDELTRIDAIIEDSNLFMKVNSLSSAGSSLLATVRKIVVDAGGEVSSVKINNTPVISKEAEMKVAYTINNDGFSLMLQEIAAAKPVLTIKELNISPIIKKVKEIVKINGRKRSRTRVVETGNLKISMAVGGFYSGENI